ncbi:MAG: hypothetical protein WD205_03870, partial [Rhodothermales bacterium]
SIRLPFHAIFTSIHLGAPAQRAFTYASPAFTGLKSAFTHAAKIESAFIIRGIELFVLLSLTLQVLIRISP